MEKRVYSFAPGPAVLPLPVLKEVQRDLLCLPGAGASILEISHRSKAFTQIIEGAEANIRKLLAVPDNYSVLFMQGGAFLQFALVALNLLRGAKKPANYIITGAWSTKAIKEAKTQGTANAAWDGKPDNFVRFPNQNELNLDSDPAYVYFCSNETIQGVQYRTEPIVGDAPLVCDSSSDIFCRPVPVEKFGLIFACAQKNAGPAGVTIVIIRDDLLQRSGDDLPSLLNYRVVAENKSLLNTPPTFGVYVVKLVTSWLIDEIGGLEKMAEINRRKSKMLYDAIDQSDGFYQGHARPESRSIMNVPFRLPNADLEGKFLAEAAERELCDLKGHRSVGGCRASLYNAMPVEGVQLLAEFMQEFQKKNK
ncbi:MAG: 3-phosphoserine/phosphohydroxythreonine transaminase [Pirellulales bacterium]|nr:3-phosphoserine/phosphohydroxythreonine transaminase [Pirellulales bacterium]